MLREPFRDFLRYLRTVLGGTSADSAERSTDTDRPTLRGNGAGEFDRSAEPSTQDDIDLVPRPQRLLSLLEANDGRLRQQEIIRETEWSSSTVSRHLRRLEDEGRLSRVLVGGEYLVLLPTVDLNRSVNHAGVGRGGFERNVPDDDIVGRAGPGPDPGPGYGGVGGGLDADGERSSD